MYSPFYDTYIDVPYKTIYKEGYCKIRISFPKENSTKYYYDPKQVGFANTSYYEVTYTIYSKLLSTNNKESIYTYDEYEILNVYCTKPNIHYDEYIKPTKKIRMIQGLEELKIYIDYVLENQELSTPRDVKCYMSVHMPIIFRWNWYFDNLYLTQRLYLKERIDKIRYELMEKTWNLNRYEKWCIVDF
jgi:hypothetical protein